MAMRVWSAACTSGAVKAAAATAVIVGVTSVGPTATPITLDHPFVFFIRDVPSGAMLFAGRVADPTAASR